MPKKSSIKFVKFANKTSKRTTTIGTQTSNDSKNTLKSDDCCVCFGKEWVCRTKCKHYVCLNCLIQIEKNCPLCRRDISGNLPVFLRSISKMWDEKTNPDLNIYDSGQFPHLF